jgi:hypothetical protein
MTHTHKIDDAWELYTTTSGGITCYDICTKTWKYRGGKIYNANKKYIILSGKCELTIEKWWEDVVSYISPNNWIFKISANVPHLFYFLEDTRMIEWFDEWTISEDFERYREMKK